MFERKSHYILEFFRQHYGDEWLGQYNLSKKSVNGMGNDLRKPICQIEVDEDDSLNADRIEDANDGKENDDSLNADRNEDANDGKENRGEDSDSV